MNLPLKQQLANIYKKPQPKKLQKRRTEVLTESDIKSLMGMDKPTYRRHRGAFRQRG
ncbi:hypothetical protein ACFFF5_21110 [Lederbergia wuyishanensis]|uniref:Uncharacterized protein n=1 Tax=Lederbergia wuyishanensis TaxID=1347903 RepID=A0ABU0D758_9BACI|nr:hypothetical protein [Lederbergia wuyishanensis]MCJ8008916.1 hypothetical protein [Lederbergia wuyishanensis]MDQ0344242.1 hypothetical protein [Lederbergia wuyishanensis]